MYHFDRYGVKERFLTEAALYPEYRLARVIAQYRGAYKIVSQQGEALAQISGSLRFGAEVPEHYPAVGDFVMVSQPEGQAGAVIHHILTRKSLFVRKAVGVTGQAQPVAANVDIVFLCMALDRNYSLNRMERYLSIAWDSGATPVAVLTKADLSGDLDAAVREVEGVCAFSDVVALSMYDGELEGRFAPYFAQNQTCAFIGSSGVGKSTLINRLLGGEVQETRALGKAEKGRHTTTGRELFPCPLGGVVIDTPGMREVGAESADLKRAFHEIEELAEACRFRDCTHTGEPGCAVLAAVEDGQLDRRRLESYRKLRKEAGYDGLSSREIEAKKLERMFKEVGGMKNARRFAKEMGKRNG